MLPFHDWPLLGSAGVKELVKSSRSGGVVGYRRPLLHSQVFDITHTADNILEALEIMIQSCIYGEKTSFSKGCIGIVGPTC